MAKKYLPIRLSEELIKKVTEKAKKAKRSRNQYIEILIEYVKIMGWKSTKEISRKELEQKIEHEILYNIENLSDETLTYILEILSDDEKSNIGSGYNYTVKDE